jgi:hypothetical protein
VVGGGGYSSALPWSLGACGVNKVKGFGCRDSKLRSGQVNNKRWVFRWKLKKFLWRL